MTTERLGEFLDDFSECFGNIRRKTLRSILYYTTGLLSQTNRKNIERIAEQDADFEYQNIHNAVSVADWDHSVVMEQVAARANESFSESDDNAYLIDESGFSKKGTKSVGVSRQWNGRLGKTDNCQVAVVGVLSSKAMACPINTKLFLPKSWTDDPDRCRKAGIPDEYIVEKSKIDLARDLIEEAISQSVDFKWIGFDSFYGRDKKFLYWIDSDLGRKFVGDVPRDTKIRLPRSKETLTVEELVARREFTVKRLRPQCKGYVEVEALSCKVEVKVDRDKWVTWRLVVTRDIGTDDIKYSLTNIMEESLEKVAYKQRQRYWVEKSFQDAKTSCGMAQYQVRTWQGWHHHMALVMVAMLFLFEERARNNEDLPLLSCQDIVTVIDHCLFKSKQTLDDRIQAIEERHYLRYTDIARRQSRFSSDEQVI